MFPSVSVKCFHHDLLFNSLNSFTKVTLQRTMHLFNAPKNNNKETDERVIFCT